MKKILIIISFFSINAYGQTSSVKFMDYDYNFNSINCGDSTYIGLSETLSIPDSFLIYIIKATAPDNIYDTCINRTSLRTMRVSDIGYLPQYIGHNGYQAGKVGLLIPSVSPGNYKLKLRAYGSHVSFDYTCSYCVGLSQFPVTCLSFGINDIEKTSHLLSTQYYNLLGQPIKEPEGVTVEVKTLSDGSRSVRKILKN
jgi:hypothetical protein